MTFRPPKRRQLSDSRLHLVGQAFLPVTSGCTHPLVLGKKAMESSNLHITHRHLPHWQLPGSIYFLTVRVAVGVLDPEERTLVLNHVRAGNARFYDLIAAVVMPDHAHVLLRPVNQLDLPRIMKGIKGVSARMLNQRRGTSGALWQDESFDRIIRDQREYGEKLAYMLDNPVKAGLVEDGFRYPWIFFTGRTDG